MLSPVAVSPPPAVPGNAPSGRSILQSQLTRYEGQLADWCSCPSGKTAEGKAKIADIQQKVDVAKARIKQIDDSHARVKETSAPQTNATAPPLELAMIGSRVDVYV
jgi:hypothetical protein